MLFSKGKNNLCNFPCKFLVLLMLFLWIMSLLFLWNTKAFVLPPTPPFFSKRDYKLVSHSVIATPASILLNSLLLPFDFMLYPFSQDFEVIRNQIGWSCHEWNDCPCRNHKTAHFCSALHCVGLQPAWEPSPGPPVAGTFILNFHLQNINFCCLYVTQFMIFCYRSLDYERGLLCTSLFLLKY